MIKSVTLILKNFFDRFRGSVWLIHSDKEEKMYQSAFHSLRNSFSKIFLRPESFIKKFNYLFQIFTNYFDGLAVEGKIILATHTIFQIFLFEGNIVINKISAMMHMTKNNYFHLLFLINNW